MSQTNQIVDDLRKKYLELRSLERRTDDMLKQVIETFYIVEGLNRLQVDLDCLDLLVKNKTHKERAEEFTLEVSANATTSAGSRKPSKLKNLLNRSRKAMTTLHLLKQPHKKETHNVEVAYLQLSRLTKLQRVKISELMKMVENTIVTNYGVLEQLRSLSDMHAKNITLWENVRLLANSFIPEQNCENVECQELNVDSNVEDIVYNSDLSDICSSHSNESIITVRRCKQPPIMATKICQTEMLLKQQKRAFDGRRDRLRNKSNQVDVGIGDGQAIRLREEQVLATLTEQKLNLVQCEEINPQSCKSTDTLRNIFEGEFMSGIGNGNGPTKQFGIGNKFLKAF